MTRKKKCECLLTFFNQLFRNGLWTNLIIDSYYLLQYPLKKKLNVNNKLFIVINIMCMLLYLCEHV